MISEPLIEPEQWVSLHGDALFAYARQRIRDRDQALELVQETFLEGLRSQQRFEGRASERTWLISILRHKILDHYRKRSCQNSPTSLEDTNPSADFDRHGHWTSPTPLPQVDLERVEFWEVFQGCLDELPQSYSEAFILCEIEGVGGTEACAILGISQVNLWARLHRARLGLRRLLSDRWIREV